jgi:DNA-binding transcriptional LysR family regulator
MPRQNINDLLAFLAVARERSFTRAAAKLGVSQSALSHTIRGLEERLGLRLLTRTTRSVSPTEAGERLLQTVGPRLEEIEAELAALSELREKPAGTVRITAAEHAANTILWPKLAKLLRKYPDIKVEIIVEQALTDIVAARYDAGVRLGEQIAKDMIAVRIGPETGMAVVGAPSYFEKRPRPKRPQDLIAHHCINLRLPTLGGLYAWEFERGKRELKVRVEGQLVFNSTGMTLRPRWPGLASRTFPQTWRGHMSLRGHSSECSPSGARHFPVVTFTIRTAGRSRPPSPYWSKRCATDQGEPQGHSKFSISRTARSRISRIRFARSVLAQIARNAAALTTRSAGRTTSAIPGSKAVRHSRHLWVRRQMARTVAPSRSSSCRPSSVIL